MRSPVAVLTCGLAVASTASVSPMRGAVTRLRGGSGIDIEDVAKAATDPETLAELQRMMADPEAMAEYQELMNDPDFRSQMAEVMAKGGDKVHGIASAISENSALTGALEALGPSIGASVDALKRTTSSAEELLGAIGALEGLAKRLATKGASEPKFRRVRLSNAALSERLLQWGGGESALRALGFRTEVALDGEPHLEHTGEGLDPGGELPAPLARALKVFAQTRDEVSQATRIAEEHGLPYALALELPKVRDACAGDSELAQLLTHMMLQNAEFRSHVSGPAAELALPSILQMVSGRPPPSALPPSALPPSALRPAAIRHPPSAIRHPPSAIRPAVRRPPLPILRAEWAPCTRAPPCTQLRSKEGIQACIEFYTGSPTADTRVVHVSSLSEWKEALDGAGERPVCALLTDSVDVGCRVLVPAFNKLPDAEGERFVHLQQVEFVHVLLDKSKDDGLVERIFDDVGVPLRDVPTFVFFGECLEHRRWRYKGADVGEVVRRLRRIVANDRLQDGPDAEPS